MLLSAEQQAIYKTEQAKQGAAASAFSASEIASYALGQASKISTIQAQRDRTGTSGDHPAKIPLTELKAILDGLPVLSWDYAAEHLADFDPRQLSTDELARLDAELSTSRYRIAQELRRRRLQIVANSLDSLTDAELARIAKRVTK